MSHWTYKMKILKYLTHLFNNYASPLQCLISIFCFCTKWASLIKFIFDIFNLLYLPESILQCFHLHFFLLLKSIKSIKSTWPRHKTLKFEYLNVISHTEKLRQCRCVTLTPLCVYSHVLITMIWCVLNGINQILHVSGNHKSKVSDSLTLHGFSVRIGVSDNKSFTSAWT